MIPKSGKPTIIKKKKIKAGVPRGSCTSSGTIYLTYCTQMILLRNKMIIHIATFADDGIMAV